MPERLAAPLLDVDFARTALYDEYAALCGIRVTGGHEHLRAVVPGEAERELLGIAPDVAAFAIDRLGLAGAQAVEWRHTLVRGDRFSVTARFSPAEGYRMGGARPTG
jgi:GntR family transcriptional regulator